MHFIFEPNDNRLMTRHTFDSDLPWLANEIKENDNRKRATEGETDAVCVCVRAHSFSQRNDFSGIVDLAEWFGECPKVISCWIHLKMKQIVIFSWVSKFPWLHSCWKSFGRNLNPEIMHGPNKWFSKHYHCQKCHGIRCDAQIFALVEIWTAKMWASPSARGEGTRRVNETEMMQRKLCFRNKTWDYPWLVRRHCCSSFNFTEIRYYLLCRGSERVGFIFRFRRSSGDTAYTGFSALHKNDTLKVLGENVVYEK